LEKFVYIQQNATTAVNNIKVFIFAAFQVLSLLFKLPDIFSPRVVVVSAESRELNFVLLYTVGSGVIQSI
jgi:hypothetical protein